MYIYKSALLSVSFALFWFLVEILRTSKLLYRTGLASYPFY